MSSFTCLKKTGLKREWVEECLQLYVYKDNVVSPLNKFLVQIGNSAVLLEFNFKRCMKAFCFKRIGTQLSSLLSNNRQLSSKLCCEMVKFGTNIPTRNHTGLCMYITCMKSARSVYRTNSKSHGTVYRTNSKSHGTVCTEPTQNPTGL